MNGDEDLGEDITMKGDKFHFRQNLAQKDGPSTDIVYDTTGYGPVEKLSFFDPKIAKAHTSFYAQQPYRLSQFATGMNGDEDLGEDITMKGDKFHFNQKPYRLSQFATGMNGDEDLGEDITMKGDKFHFRQNLAQKDGPSTGIVYDTTGYGPVEKLSFFDPKIAKAHTSFYAQAEPEAEAAPEKKKAAPIGEPEKVQILDPKIAKAHTTFYNGHKALGQEEPAQAATINQANAEPEKVQILDPKIAKAHTTFYHGQQ